jgi:uncharacterized protein
MNGPVRRPPPRAAAASAGPAPPPLSDRELDALQTLLDRVPAPLEPLDVGMLDGFLCGVLLQPQAIPPARWLAHVTDAEGRALPAHFDVKGIHDLVQRRHLELDRAIERRQWFDPWVFELADPDGPGSEEDAALQSIDAVYPWVAGFATAVELFPGLMSLDAEALCEPLALLYRHLDADDLEDAEALLAEIDALEPAADLSEAVEDLVRATLLLADISRPRREDRPAGARSRHRTAAKGPRKR